jgi:hypothetical protein
VTVVALRPRTIPRGTVAKLAAELEVFARGRLAKAALPAAIAARDALVEPFAEDLADYFEAFLGRAGIAKDVAFPFDPDDIDWVSEGAELGKVLARWYTKLGELAFGAAAEQLVLTEIRFDLAANDTRPIRDLLAREVTRISDTTRDIIVDKVETAIARGLSVDELVAGTGDFTGLRDLFGSRAQTIALTETATAYNTASLAGYGASGLVDEVEVFDGLDCGWTSHDDPDLADGSRRTLEEASEQPISHPNCQRAFGPVALR